MRCVALEERLVELVISAMERTETEMNQANESQSGFEEISGATLYMWQHLSTQLIFFVLFQFASFPHIVMSVNDKASFLVFLNLKISLLHVMWGRLSNNRVF